MAEWAREQNGGSKAIYNLQQLTSQTTYDSNCKKKSNILVSLGVCIITFLPHILDSSEEQR